MKIFKGILNYRNDEFGIIIIVFSGTSKLLLQFTKIELGNCY